MDGSILGGPQGDQQDGDQPQQQEQGQVPGAHGAQGPGTGEGGGEHHPHAGAEVHKKAAEGSRPADALGADEGLGEGGDSLPAQDGQNGRTGPRPPSTC